MTPRTKAEEAIQAWMLSCIKNHGYERYDDLHIDQIDQLWKNRGAWIEHGLEALKLATNLRNEWAPSFSVALAFPLSAGEEPLGPNFANLNEIRAQLGSAPPSIYLFRKGMEPWNPAEPPQSNNATDNNVVQEVRSDVFEGLAVPNRCYYIEFRAVEFNEYSRSLLVVG